MRPPGSGNGQRGGFPGLHARRRRHPYRRHARGRRYGGGGGRRACRSDHRRPRPWQRGRPRRHRFRVGGKQGASQWLRRPGRRRQPGSQQPDGRFQPWSESHHGIHDVDGQPVLRVLEQHLQFRDGQRTGTRRIYHLAVARHRADARDDVPGELHGVHYQWRRHDGFQWRQHRPVGCRRLLGIYHRLQQHRQPDFHLAGRGPPNRTGR